MKIFISHISEETPIALVLKDWIESTFINQCDVFVSSDKDDLPAGSRWLEEINNAVNNASVVIVLCSPSSLARPWINFETGCAWMRNIPIIPICHSGQTKMSLPVPMSTFNALDLDDKAFVEDLFSSLVKFLKLEKYPRIDRAAMRRELQKAVGELKSGSGTATSKDETGTNAELVDEIRWRLNELLRMVSALAERKFEGQIITIQDYHAIAQYIDKVFNGEIHFYKLFDREKLLALLSRLVNSKQTNELAEIKTFLEVLERTHRNKSNYNETANKLKEYQVLLQA